MNIDKVNSTLNQAIAQFQTRTLDEMYVGYGGTEGGGSGADDYTAHLDPTGDPDRGGEHGVANHESSQDQFESYIEHTALHTSKRCNMAPGKVLEALVTLAAQHQQQGHLPAFPDVDSAKAEQFSAWTGAAKQLGFGAMLTSYCGG